MELNGSPITQAPRVALGFVHHTAKDIRDLASAPQLFLERIIGLFHTTAQFIGALEVHRQLVLEVRHARRFSRLSA